MNRLQIYDALNRVALTKLQPQFPYTIQFTEKVIEIQIKEHPGIFTKPPEPAAHPGSHHAHHSGSHHQGSHHQAKNDAGHKGGRYSGGVKVYTF